ncbi:hypothetical protein [Moorena sp. SIO3H5]|uniref:hypothetical protein n=1 Tax=Moorena sp. SIO3H5 TaxID=2607834 RepID=UPI0013B63708|nr:hypothetical protein [Moorena sp. SIO3H5]NEO74598.1 hypothetical protein [Moorena sp. SIO3H5]
MRSRSGSEGTSRQIPLNQNLPQHLQHLQNAPQRPVRAIRVGIVKIFVTSSLLPAPCSLLPIPYSLFPVPCSLCY